MPTDPYDFAASAPSTSAPLSRRALMRHASHAAWALPLWGTLGGYSTQAGAQARNAKAVESWTQARWASGGTAGIGAAARAVKPFAATAVSSSCQLSCEATIGPCHTQSPERQDISDGWNGLPMLMQLRVVDAQCQPVAGAIVEVWHTNHTGGYSGDIHPMCNNNAQDKNRQFFRGWQRTDELGVVHFDSCFPGWYGGRANHVHLRVMKGSYDGRDRAPSWLVSQLLFPDALNTAIFEQQPLYIAKGLPDTTLDTDNVIGNESDKSPYLFDIQNVGGVMLASKTLVIRSNLDDAVCQARGKRPSGPPPGSRGPGRGMRPPGEPPRQP
ncbi:MAG: intradiol ring-cleavage dioxygenase [Comamonas sp.]